MIMTLTPCETRVPFSAISIGEPFFHMNRFFVKTSHTAGADLSLDSGGYGICTFFIPSKDDRSPEEEYTLNGYIIVNHVDVSYAG